MIWQLDKGDFEQGNEKAQVAETWAFFVPQRKSLRHGEGDWRRGPQYEGRKYMFGPNDLSKS